MNLAELVMSLEIGLIYAVVAIGIYLTFRIIDFPDLTCDGSFVLGAAVSCVLIKNGVNPYLSLLVACTSGAVAGGITGFLNVKLRITSLLSGILVAFMLYSINLKVMWGLPNLAIIGEETIFSQTSPLLVLISINILIYFLIGYLLSTDLGLALRSIGQNVRLSKNVGINVSLIKILGLAISNSLIALGGALFCQHQAFVDVGSGIGTLIVGLASVMIGERLLPYRSPWFAVTSCILGSIIYRIFISLALHSEVLGLETQDLNLITGLLVILVMNLPGRRYVSFERY